MKIKRFNNLWAMGLIIFGALLVAFYVGKIFFPEFIIGVAQIPSIVSFGNYCDTHKWAFLLLHFTISYLGLFLYCCACCRQTKLTKIQNIVLIVNIIIGICVQQFLPKIYTSYNYVIFILIPYIYYDLFFNRHNGSNIVFGN